MEKGSPGSRAFWRRAWESRHFHDTLTVCLSYGVTILTVKLRGGIAVESEGEQLSPWSALGLLALFTATHSVGASAFYGIFISRFPASSNRTAAGLIGCIIYFHMAFWYGMPTVALSAFTLTPAPLLAVAHIVLCRGTRLWRTLAYGAAFLSLLLLVAMTGGLRADTPLWLLAAAVAYQILLLRLQGRFVARFFLPR